MTSANADDIAIFAENVSVKYLIRYYRSHVTLRNTVLNALHPRRRRKNRSRWTAEHWAIRDVSFELRSGEVGGFIGRNGSGKTTLLQTVAGVFEPDTGSLVHRGEMSCLLSLGAGFNPTLTGRENIYLNGAILGVPHKTVQDSIDEVIDFSDLGEFIDAPVRTYSAGMVSRLGFSVAMLVDPDVVVLDEVIRAGDAAFREKAGTFLDRFRDRGKTILIASHSMDVIRRQCDRVFWLDRGELRMEGGPEEVTAAYLEEAKQQKDRLGSA